MGKGWTQEQIEKLKRLRQAGASAARVALAVKWNKTAVKAKARELGMPFPNWRNERSAREAKEQAARAKAGLPPKPF
jgi:hypothetical protein